MAQKVDSCTVGIVTFNPDAIRLKANIDNILKNTTKANIVVADNGSKNIDEIKKHHCKQSPNSITAFE